MAAGTRRKRCSARGRAAAVLVLAVAVLAIAATPIQNEHAKLVASDGGGGDQLGISVAVSGTTIVAGANRDDDGGLDAGAAYVFTPDGSGGYDEFKLTASDAAPGDHFGSRVAVSGSTVVVGAWSDDADKGAAYVYSPTAGGGYAETKLTASDGAAGDGFGISVAVSGTTIVVGSRESAYVYAPAAGGGYDETKLTASDGVVGDQFGVAVAISGTKIVVGANFAAVGGVAAGAVYVFTPAAGGGYDEAKLTASDGQANDFLGMSLAVSGDTVVAGAWGDDDIADLSGAAYVFTPNGSGGHDEIKLKASDGAGGDGFGHTVAVSSGTVVVGAVADTAAGVASGAAYVFTPNGLGGYVEAAKLAASDAAAFDLFANVAVSGGIAVVGAQSKGPGAVYVFRDLPLPPAPAPKDDGWLRPSSVRAPPGGGMLIVNADLDIGDRTVDFQTDTCTIEYGASSLSMTGMQRVRKGLYRYRTADGKTRVVIRTSRYLSSKSKLQLIARDWDGQLGGAQPGELHLAVTSPPALDATAEISPNPISGRYDSRTDQASEPLLAVEVFNGALTGLAQDRLTMRLEFGGDGMIGGPPAPDVLLRFGPPGSLVQTLLTPADYTITPIPGGYRYTRVDNSAPGIRFLTLDFGRRRATVVVRNVDLGVPRIGKSSEPFYVSLSLNGVAGPERAVQFSADHSAARLTYK